MVKTDSTYKILCGWIKLIVTPPYIFEKKDNLISLLIQECLVNNQSNIVTSIKINENTFNLDITLKKE